MDDQHVLDVVRRALEQPRAKCKVIANAVASPNGEYWTAILIANPVYTNDAHGKHGKYEVLQGNHESDSGQTPQESLPAQAGEQHHWASVCHSADKDALLGLCHHLLLDAIFCLWSYSDSLSTTSVPQNTYTVKG